MWAKWRTQGRRRRAFHEDYRDVRGVALGDFYWAFKRSQGKWIWLGESEGCVHHARTLTWCQVEGNSLGFLGKAWSQFQAEARNLMPCLPMVQLWSLSRNHSFSEISHPGLFFSLFILLYYSHPWSNILVQFNLEQHRLELPGSTYMQMFSINIVNPPNPRVSPTTHEKEYCWSKVGICGCREPTVCIDMCHFMSETW